MTTNNHSARTGPAGKIAAAHTKLLVLMFALLAGSNAWAQDEAAMENEDEPAAQRNLFGELLGQPDDQKQQSRESVLMQRVEGLIERTSELSTRHETAVNRFGEAQQMLAQKKSEYAILPKQYDAIALKILSTEIRQQQMRQAGVISLPSNHPQVIQFQQDQIQLQQWQAEAAVMKQKSQLLPNEVRNLSNELATLNQTLNANAKQFGELIAAWDEVTSALRWMSPQDADDVASRCTVFLERYPKITFVRIMLGYCHLHLQQPNNASQSFDQALAEHATAGDMLSKTLQLKCHLGLLWTSLQQKDLEEAGRQVALSSKIDAGNYELAIAKAELLKLRARNTNAFDQYRRAVAIAKKRTDGYWRAADLVLQTSVRPDQIALQLAKTATELDESNDWRIALTLALAYLRLEQSDLFEEQIAQVRSDAPEAALASIDKQLLEFQQLISNEQ